MDARIFYPTSSLDASIRPGEGQRYRNAYGDVRLSRKGAELHSEMVKQQSVMIHQLGEKHGDIMSYYRFLHNDSVSAAELIYHSCRLAKGEVSAQDLLVCLDTTSVACVSRIKEKRSGKYPLGVIEDNRTPGFFMHTALVIHEASQYVVGLGDMVVFNRPQNDLSPETKVAHRAARAKLPLSQKESYVWALAAKNTQAQLSWAHRVTYLLDQGGDKYESLARLVADTGADFILRSKEDRRAIDVADGFSGKLSQILARQEWVAPREVAIDGLDHYSKTHGKRIERQKRVAKLRIRYCSVHLALPSGYSKEKPRMNQSLTLIEVCEDPSTVPKGEAPIHWRLLSSRAVKEVQEAWHLVQCYGQRWHIEQLFRVFKKQGLDIEHTQIKNPKAVIKQAIMAMKAALEVMQLTLARDGKADIPIQTVFNQQEQLMLQQLNLRFEGKTQKQQNPHSITQLAWATWIIARLGGWKGYQSQRPPGPIIIQRGLSKFLNIIWALTPLDSS